MTTLVDLAREEYPAQSRCRHCHVVVDKRDSRWLDRSGQEECATGGGTLHWGVPVPKVQASPLLRGRGF